MWISRLHNLIVQHWRLSPGKHFLYFLICWICSFVFSGRCPYQFLRFWRVFWLTFGQFLLFFGLHLCTLCTTTVHWMLHTVLRSRGDFSLQSALFLPSLFSPCIPIFWTLLGFLLTFFFKSYLRHIVTSPFWWASPLRILPMFQNCLRLATISGSYQLIFLSFVTHPNVPNLFHGYWAHNLIESVLNCVHVVGFERSDSYK